MATATQATASEALKELFVAQLQDAYSAEGQIAAALPKMAQAAKSPQLKAAFELHLTETKNQSERLEQVCQAVGCDPSGETCEATEGLVEEGQEVIDMNVPDEVRDAGLIIAAQKVEHYEIALYGGLCALAKRLGRADLAATLHQSLEEEKATDVKLTALAEGMINQQAARA
jgi:ferritin-like metal-binding protein YciE